MIIVTIIFMIRIIMITLISYGNLTLSMGKHHDNWCDNYLHDQDNHDNVGQVRELNAEYGIFFASVPVGEPQWKTNTWAKLVIWITMTMIMIMMIKMTMNMRTMISKLCPSQRTSETNTCAKLVIRMKMTIMMTSTKLLMMVKRRHVESF